MVYSGGGDVQPTWREYARVLEKAVLMLATCSHDCTRVGIWYWHDEDGEEFLCDQHKTDSFYVVGPELIEELENVRKLIDLAKREEY